MKNLLLLLVLLTGCSTLDRLLPGTGNRKGAGEPIKREYYTFLVAGQSNSVSPAQQHEPMYSTTQMVQIWHEWYAPQLYTPTKEYPCSALVSFIHMGDILAGKLNKNIRIIDVGVGNTSIGQWIRKENYSERITKAILKYKPDAILWIQGESDKYTSKANYYNELKVLISKCEGIPFFTALDYLPGGTGGSKDGQQQAIDEGLAYLGADCAVIRDAGLVESCQAEFVGAGLEMHGSLWADALLKNQIWNK